MTNPPGCPSRRVDEIQPTSNGAYLKLSCGHWLWEAGFSDNDFDNVTRFNVERPCLGGCYIPQVPMGDGH